MSLYFIALIPGEDLKEEIKDIKEDFAQTYDARHALKLPAHVTLIIPFKMNEKEEVRLTAILSHFSEQQACFHLLLSGFDSFPPRVIFINIANKRSVINLQKRLQQTLRVNNLAGENNEKEIFHPHITIASRDLKRGEFKNAWPVFKQQTFEREWVVNKIVLLKHNGRKWEIHKEFFFKEY